jgi:hypothetical protein
MNLLGHGALEANLSPIVRKCPTRPPPASPPSPIERLAGAPRFALEQQPSEYERGKDQDCDVHAFEHTQVPGRRRLDTLFEAFLHSRAAQPP